jgi:uncharacterized Zn finger protein
MVTNKVKELPNAIYTECPKCNSETIHNILKGKLSTKKNQETLDCTVECNKCKSVHKALIRTPRILSIPVILSSMGSSEQKIIDLNSNDVLQVNDEIIIDDINIKITSLETKNEKRPENCKVEDLKTIWAKRYDKVRVKVTINKGTRTYSQELWAVPDEEFYIGDMLTFGRLKAVIHRIKTTERLLKLDGSMATAREIVRIYGSAIR